MTHDAYLALIVALIVMKEGHWKDGSPDGFGVLKHVSGRVEYEGQFRRGSRAAATTEGEVEAEAEPEEGVLGSDSSSVVQAGG